MPRAFWTFAGLVIVLGVQQGCRTGPLFGPDPFHHELVRQYDAATGYYARHFPPELVCLEPSQPLCRCQSGQLDGAVGGLSPEARVDLNAASLEELQRLPGVGLTLAERIAARRSAAPFDRIDDLLDVEGIGRGRLARLRPLVRVAP